MKHLKKGILALAVILLFLFISYFVPWKKEIDLKLSGLIFRIGDPEYSEEILITVQGTYKQYLMRRNKFKGKIDLGGDHKYVSDELEVILFFSDGYSALSYFGISKDKPVIETPGLICAKPDFSELVVCIYEPIKNSQASWDGENGLIVSAPAQDRQQAMSLAKEFFDKSEFLSHTLVK